MKRLPTAVVLAYAEAQMASLSLPRPVRAGWRYEESRGDEPDRWVHELSGCVITDTTWDDPMTIYWPTGRTTQVHSTPQYRRLVDWLEGRL